MEIIFSEQKEELEARRGEKLCQRSEEKLVDLKSPQAQVVIGVRRSGKSTLCYQVLENAGAVYAYADFDDERLANFCLLASKNMRKKAVSALRRKRFMRWTWR